MPLDYYVTKNNTKLRCGYTTGSCAIMAVKAGMEMLFTKNVVPYASILTPKGIEVSAEVLDICIEDNQVTCCVVKDGGDDIDVTNGLKIFARVSKCEEGITIDGGNGVGRVTKKGLDQPIGYAAINATPRKLMLEEAKRISKKYNYTKGIKISIFVPNGKETAKKTFNPRLGIVGGISIIGTSGIVEPMSLSAIKHTIKLEIKMLSENGEDKIIATPGNYGENFIKALEDIQNTKVVKFSNFVGDMLDYSKEYGIKKVLLIGHIGKFVKLAGGIMNTHSNNGDCRMEILAAHASFFGESDVCKKIMDCVTTDEAIDILESYGLKNKIMKSIVKKAEYYVDQRTYGAVETGVVIFSNKHGILAIGKGGKKLLEELRSKND